MTTIRHTSLVTTLKSLGFISVLRILKISSDGLLMIVWCGVLMEFKALMVCHWSFNSVTCKLKLLGEKIKFQFLVKN